MEDLIIHGFTTDDAIAWFESRFVKLGNISLTEEELVEITLKWEGLKHENKITVTKFFLDYFRFMEKWDFDKYSFFSAICIIDIELLLSKLKSKKELTSGVFIRVWGDSDIPFDYNDATVKEFSHLDKEGVIWCFHNETDRVTSPWQNWELIEGESK